MSVVPMKLLTIAGPLDRFDDVVRTCVIDQEFHPENALQLMRGVGGLRPLELENPYAALLRRSIEVADEAGIPLDYAPFDPTASLEEMAGYFDSLADQASASTGSRRSWSTSWTRPAAWWISCRTCGAST